MEVQRSTFNLGGRAKTTLQAVTQDIHQDNQQIGLHDDDEADGESVEDHSLACVPPFAQRHLGSKIMILAPFKNEMNEPLQAYSK